jgi:hypothetical protein
MYRYFPYELYKMERITLPFIANPMQLKSKFIYNINKAISFSRRPAGYIKAPVIAVAKLLPQSTRQEVTQSKLYKQFNTVVLASGRSPRVYVKKGIGRMQFFEIMNQRKVEYVLLRWWQNLPDIPPGEDMDILIKDDHRDRINDLVTFHDNGSGIMCDIYTVSGVKYGCRRNIPYFQANLAHTLLRTRALYRGAFVPSSLPYFASLAYHAVFHKGFGSGLPGYGMDISGVEHDYTAILTDLANEIGINVEVTVQGLYDWLKLQGFAPADDTLTKLIEHKPELSILEVPLSSDARGGELLVFIARERLVKDGLIHDFKSFLEDKYQLDIINVRMLRYEEQEDCTLQIRGGKWDKGPFKYSGGKPKAFVVAYDYHPKPLNNAEHKTQTRMTNKNNMEAKYVYRDRLNSLILIKGDYNGVHSADNEQDAWSYISILGEEYCELIAQEVECRRRRYARKWGILKTLSAGPRSKVEVIKYGEGLAVKKTFKPGRKRFFTRELFAVKELSKQLDFVPPLLEEGDGYFVVPYLENVLDRMNEQEKKQLLASKANEITDVINAMYNRGLAYINFTPSSIIITPDNKLYCTGFEFLHKYDKLPSDIQYAYEVAGLPKNFKGDCPEGLYNGGSSFNRIWGPYIGQWKKAASKKVLA